MHIYQNNYSDRYSLGQSVITYLIQTQFVLRAGQHLVTYPELRGSNVMVVLLYRYDHILEMTMDRSKLLTKFEQQFGRKANFIVRCPGRVNLIGNVDYFVLFLIYFQVNISTIVDMVYYRWLLISRSLQQYRLMMMIDYNCTMSTMMIIRKYTGR